jgi:CheY-like chemotaxis protein
MNLCVNARDAMPQGGLLTLKAENRLIHPDEARQLIDATPGPYIVITVADTGTGIPSASLEKIFEPFFTTKEPGRGTGLGLSTAHAIIKGHKGFIRVNSTVGKGTEFHIFLPAHGSEAPLTAEQETEAHLTGQGERILVIDDERMVLSMTEEMLTAYGYSAVTSLHGKEGLSVYAREGDTIGAVIVDMMMPHMDGAATIQALRRMNPKVKILAMSGVPDESRTDGERSLVRHFLPKPFTAATLLTALRDLLAGIDGAAETPGGTESETKGVEAA